ncbi:hypothetical protein [Streptomyces daliensis]|uniref:Uncharacterized protein n=1 Tax=Streptomyces daliensis TaxID=299421 RepID=A0A8T4IW36_9ACTN|nr:hypothetical protein [Streptomyces daliensis]
MTGPDGAHWLARCSPAPDTVFAAWAREELARIPAPPAWAVAEADLLHSVRAMEPLSRTARLGPVLAHPETERAWWLVPPDAHEHLTDLHRLTLHERGWPLLCPSPQHGAQGMCWLERPDGTGKLTDPAALAAAFGRGGRDGHLPAEAFGVRHEVASHKRAICQREEG